MTAGQTELLQNGHRRRFRRSRRTFQGLLAGWSSGRTMPEYTAASGRRDYATFRKRADASVRCTGFGSLFATHAAYLCEECVLDWFETIMGRFRRPD